MTLTKQNRQLDDSVTFLNRELVKHISEKHECQSRLEALESSMRNLAEVNEMLRREHKAMQDTNEILDKQVRKLGNESQMFLTQLIELKEK
jgi:DNA integrity scanning protein DisA with diadenylate cyclase activity